MQRDVMEEKCSEMDGLVYEVVRMGEEYKVDMPQYKKQPHASENRES